MKLKWVISLEPQFPHLYIKLRIISRNLRIGNSMSTCNSACETALLGPSKHPHSLLGWWNSPGRYRTVAKMSPTSSVGPYSCLDLLDSGNDENGLWTTAGSHTNIKRITAAFLPGSGPQTKLPNLPSDPSLKRPVVCHLPIWTSKFWHLPSNVKLLLVYHYGSNS